MWVGCHSVQCVRDIRRQISGACKSIEQRHQRFCACTQDVEQTLWKVVWYRPIEEFRRRIRLASEAGDRGREPLRKVQTMGMQSATCAMSAVLGCIFFGACEVSPTLPAVGSCILREAVLIAALPLHIHRRKPHSTSCWKAAPPFIDAWRWTCSLPSATAAARCSFPRSPPPAPAAPHMPQHPRPMPMPAPQSPAASSASVTWPGGDQNDV